MDEGCDVSRHGLRLLAAVKSWSKTNVLAEEVVPGGGGLASFSSRYRHSISWQLQQIKE